MKVTARAKVRARESVTLAVVNVVCTGMEHNREERRRRRKKGRREFNQYSRIKNARGEGGGGGGESLIERS